MRDKELYTTILGIQKPWIVTGVDLDPSEEEVHVHVEWDPDVPLPCPTCGDICPRKDHRRRSWRHLDTCQYRTILEADVPRVKCGEHGVHQVEVPWAEPRSGFTALFESLAIDWLKEASVSAVARRLRLTWDEVDGIMQRAVRRGLERRGPLELEEIGVDETSFQKRHEYVTVVSDLARNRVVYVADNRKEETLSSFYESLSIEQREHIRGGDGVLDIVGGSWQADVNGVSNAGAAYYWKGGQQLSGSLFPNAILSVANASPNDYLTNSSGRGIQCGEVTGDGIADVIVGASFAGDQDQGFVYVWSGGEDLQGTSLPDAWFGGAQGDRIGDSSGQGIILVDVTADDVLDLIVGSQYGDGRTLDTGIVRVQTGGASLIGGGGGFELKDPDGRVNDRLGFVSGQGIQFGDVTGDGVLDIVVGAQLANPLDRFNAGAVYVFSGGSILESAPTAILVGGLDSSHQLGNVSGNGFQLHDLNGDGVADIIAGTQLADSNNVVDTGSAYVWIGGGLSGTVFPTATMKVSGAFAHDRLGYMSGQAIQIADVTGDGIPEVVIGAQDADVNGSVNAGAIYAWDPSVSLSGTIDPTATLTVPGSAAGDALGDSAGQGIQFADLTGDGVLDMVAGARLASVGVVAEAGAAYLWSGGNLVGPLDPSITITTLDASQEDRLGDAAGQGIIIADLAGSNLLDVLGAYRSGQAMVIGG